MTVEKLAENLHSHASAYGLVKDRFGSRLPTVASTVLYAHRSSVQAGFSDFRKIFSCRLGGVGRPDPERLSPSLRPLKGLREWRRPGSNRQPPACKAGALPIELRPRDPLRGKSETRISKLETFERPAAAFRISGFGLRISFGDQPKEVGPGRFGLPTSRLSGVRSNQLSYEPWKKPTSALYCPTRQPQLVRTSVYNDVLDKEQQKNRCFYCQRFAKPCHRSFRQSKLEFGG